MSENHLHIFVHLRKSLQDFDPEEFSGILLLNEPSFTLLNKFQNTEIITNIQEPDGSFKAAQQLKDYGKERNIKVFLSKSALRKIGYIYFETVKEFVSQYPDELPDKEFYVHETDYFSSNAEKPSVVSAHHDIIRLIKILEVISDHNQRSGKLLTLYFLLKTKIEVPIQYDVMNLKRLKEIENLEIAIFLDRDKEKSREILKNCIDRFFHNVTKENRFVHLVNNFSDFYENYINNFSLYLSEFSFHKMEKEFEEKKIKFISQINSVITEIQNKIIALPIAFLIAAGQMEESSDAKNLALFIGTFCFGILSHLMVKSQINSLSGIHNDIDENENDIKETSITVYKKLKPRFAGLRAHYNNQRAVLFTLLSIVWGITILAGILYFHFSHNLEWSDLKYFWDDFVRVHEY